MKKKSDMNVYESFVSADHILASRSCATLHSSGSSVSVLLFLAKKQIVLSRVMKLFREKYILFVQGMM